jgi:hypothetical protein
MEDDQEKIDEALGISRCARCGHRLDGEIECPFCAIVEPSRGLGVIPKWIYITACFLTSPLSIYFVARSSRLSRGEKILAISGCLLWTGLYFAVS